MSSKVLLLFNLVVLSQSGPLHIDSPEGVTLLEVPFGKTVVLRCLSNDERHNFDFWHVIKGNYIIGPSNKNFDNGKYRYEVLSGNLTIKGVTKEEEGLYNCVSKGVKGENVNIKSSKLVVQKDWEDVYEHDSSVNAFRIVLIIATLTVLGVGCFMAYKIWKDRFRYPRYLEEEDDDDSAEEIFRAPGTSRSSGNIVRDRDESYENLNIDTDFKSILDNVRK